MIPRRRARLKLTRVGDSLARARLHITHVLGDPFSITFRPVHHTTRAEDELLRVPLGEDLDEVEGSSDVDLVVSDGVAQAAGYRLEGGKVDSGGDARSGGSASVEVEEGSEAGAVLDVAGVEVEGWVTVDEEALVVVVLGG